MALHNLARVTSATAGTGTLTLGTAVSGFLLFADAGVVDGETVTYAIRDGANSEIGRGVYNTAGTTLTRATILESTNGGSAISCSGSQEVFITAAAEDFVFPQQVIVPVMFPSSKTGDFSAIVDTSSVWDMVYLQGTAAINDYVEYLVLLQSGTWRVDILYMKGNDGAIATCTLDGSSFGTFDLYNGSLSRNQLVAFTSISVAQTGVKLFRLAALTKNASSSNYYISITYIVWTKTG